MPPSLSIPILSGPSLPRGGRATIIAAPGAIYRSRRTSEAVKVNSAAGRWVQYHDRHGVATWSGDIDFHDEFVHQDIFNSKDK